MSTLWTHTCTPADFPASIAQLHQHESSGLLSHLSVYFLIGNKLAASAVAAAPAADKKGAPPAAVAGGSSSPSAPTSPPVLTKLVLLRSDVILVEKGLRRVRDRLVDAWSKGAKFKLAQIALAFSNNVKLLLSLLKNGFIDPAEAFVIDELEEEGDKNNNSDKTQLASSSSSSTGGGSVSRGGGDLGAAGLGQKSVKSVPGAELSSAAELPRIEVVNDAGALPVSLCIYFSVSASLSASSSSGKLKLTNHLPNKSFSYTHTIFIHYRHNLAV